MSGRVETFGPATLHHARCGDVLPGLQGVDALISDPQYEDIDTDSMRFSGGGRKRGGGVGDWSALPGVTDADLSVWLAYPRVVLWGYNHLAPKLPVGSVLVWDKRTPDGFLSDAELAWRKGGHGIYIYRRVFCSSLRSIDAYGYLRHGSRAVHPHQKPTDLLGWCIEGAKVPPGGLIVDPHMGSGTTGIAALKLGHRFVGVECVAEYFETACERFDRLTRQGDLLSAL